MANNDLQAWTNAFYQRMQQAPAQTAMSAITTPTGSTLADLMLAQEHPAAGSLSSMPLQHADPVTSSPSGFERAMDILSRPLYASANVAEALINNLSSDSVANAQNPFEEAGKGITGKEKTTYGQVVEKEFPNAPHWAKVAAGIVGDVGLDPLNLVPGKAIASGAKAVRGAVSGSTKTAKALKEAEKIATAIKAEESASDLAASKLAEAQDAGTNLDQSVIDQVLHDNKKATEVPSPSSSDDIMNLITQAEKSPGERHADEIKSQIGEPAPYIDPSTIVEGAQRSRIDLRNPAQAKMEADLVNVVTPDDMKAWRTMYKDQFPSIEQKGLSSVRDVARFKTMATNFMSRAKAPEATTLSDILLNTEAFHPDTIADFVKTHGVESVGDVADKYRFTPDSIDRKAQTIVSPPVKKASQLAEETAARIAEDRKIAAETGVAPGIKGAADDALMNTVKEQQAAVKAAAKDAEKSAKQAEATPTKTSAPKVYGNDAQGSSIQRYVTQANKANAKDGIKGIDAAAATREHVLSKMQIIEDAARADGDDLFVHTGKLTPATRKFNISATQAMKALVEHSPEAVANLDRSMFNASTGIGTDAFQNGVAETLRLYDDWISNPANAGKEWDGFENSMMSNNIEDAMRDATDSEYLKRWTEPTGSASRQGYYKKMLPEMENQRALLAQHLDAIAPKLHDIAAENVAARTATDAIDSKTIGDTVTNSVDTAAGQGSASGLKEISEAIDDVKKQSEQLGASPKASYEAAARVASHINARWGVTQEQVRRLRQTAEARAKNGRNAQSQANRLAREQAKDDIKEADEIGTEVFGPEYTHDLSQQVNAGVQNMFMKTLNALGRRFSYGFKAGELATILKDGRSASYTIGKRMDRLLTDITKRSTKEQQVEAMKQIRMLQAPAAGTAERALYDNLKEALDMTYDTSVFAKSGSELFTNWFSQGIPLEEMNRQLAAVRLPHRFKEVPDGHWSEIPQQWKDWEIDDPVAFAHKSFEAMQRVAANKSVATYAATKYGVRKPPGPGWVKLVDKTGDSPILPYMDDLYYPKEMAEQIHNLDWMMKQSVSFAGNNTGLGKFVREVVDPYMQLWKPLITIAKPGHHIRNITGDFFISALDMGFTRLGPAYAKAARIMHGNRAFEGAQAITQTGQLVEKIGPNAGKERLGIKLKGGQKVMLDDANVYKLAFQHGLLPEFTKSEDLMEATGSGLLSKAADKLTSSKPMQKVGEFAEYSSHVGRMAHLIGLLDRPSFTRKFGSLEEAMTAASERVKKFHPDTSGLAPFEQKWMRRVFPFYTWFRQTSPVVMGALFTKPARVMAPSKIQYNIALQMGVDPNSLGDPFPDGNYPSWIRDSMTGPVGPGGNMFSLGTPQEGFLPDFVNPGVNPVRSLANMVNPLAKTPYEAITGTKVQTATPITDKSEFWDQIVPGATSLGQLTSTSPLGTLGNLATGEELDPLHNVIKDGQRRYWNRNLQNFFTGLSVTNANTPTVQNSAAYERSQR